MKAPGVHLATGKLGEQIGESFLLERGYRILGRNVRSPFGEIDLVADHQGTLVFVEIKARRSQAFGFAEEAVDRRKRDRLTRLASWYLACHPKLHSPVRFDVLTLQWEGGKQDIHLIENAFEL
jgi:putative endonuclease